MRFWSLDIGPEGTFDDREEPITCCQWRVAEPPGWARTSCDGFVGWQAGEVPERLTGVHAQGVTHFTSW